MVIVLLFLHYNILLPCYISEENIVPFTPLHLFNNYFTSYNTNTWWTPKIWCNRLKALHTYTGVFTICGGLDLLRLWEATKLHASVRMQKYLKYSHMGAPSSRDDFLNPVTQHKSDKHCLFRLFDYFTGCLGSLHYSLWNVTQGTFMKLIWNYLWEIQFIIIIYI